MCYPICVCITFSVPWFFTLLQMQNETGTLNASSQHTVKVRPHPYFNVKSGLSSASPPPFLLPYQARHISRDPFGEGEDIGHCFYFKRVIK